MYNFFLRVWHKLLRKLENQEQLRELISEEFDNFTKERLDSKYELIDPELIPLEFVDLYASDYGEKLDRQYSTSGTYLRRQLQNIVSKIKSKSLPDMVYYLLYTFNFTGGLFNLWTSDYNTFLRQPLDYHSGVLYSDTGLYSDTSYLAGGSDENAISSDNLFPTAHFSIVLYLNKTQLLSQSSFLWERVYLDYFKSLLDERRGVKQVPHYTLQLTGTATNDTNVTEIFNSEGSWIASMNVTSNWNEGEASRYIYWRAGTGFNPSRNELQTSSFSDTDIKEKFKITFNDDTNSSLQNKYFQFKDNDNLWLYVWYNVDSGGINPHALGTGLEVNISSNDTASDIRQATYDVLVLNSSFTFPINAGNELGVELVDFGNSEKAYDGTTGFLIEQLAIGQKVEYGLGTLVVKENNIDFRWNWNNSINPKNEDITEFAMYNNLGDCIIYVQCLPIQRSALSSLEIVVTTEKTLTTFEILGSGNENLLGDENIVLLG